jgi:hypothetical protein
MAVPRFQIGIDAQLLIERLGKAEAGETIAYRELSEVIKRDIQKFRGPLMTARRALQRERQIVFECVTDVGLKRIVGIEIVDSAATATHAIGRTAKRAVRKLGCAEYETMDAGGKIKFNATASILGAVELFARPKSMKALEQRVEETANKLPSAETLRLFCNGSK